VKIVPVLTAKRRMMMRTRGRK
jgi:hypothetical protein